MFEKEWFPSAYSIGISWNDFWELNPKIINLMLDGYKERKQAEMEEKNFLAHLQGAYFADAIMATIGNAFTKGKKHEYPKNPYEISKGNKTSSESEIQAQRDLFVAKLQMMKLNYDLNK